MSATKEFNHSSPRKRVVVSGMGIASAIGVGKEAVWESLMAGTTGICKITAFDTTDFKIKIGAQAPVEIIQEKLAKLNRRPSDRTLDLTLVAAHEALQQAALVGEEPPFENQDIAVIFGTGTGPSQSLGIAFESFFEKGPKGVRPTTVPRSMYNALSAGLSLQFKLTGTNYVVVSACTSATNAIGVAYRMIRDGYAETVVTGGADAFLQPFFFGVWNNIPALSKIEDPLKACRPFAADREGTALGEGAGVLVLESYEKATARGVNPIGEILGYGESSDAKHLTSPDVEGQAKAMQMALDDAGLSPTDLSFVNTHGTATPGNDGCESQSIRTVMGDAVDGIPISALKSYFGHTLGASGALESVATLMSLQHGIVPSNLNLENPDPECKVNLIGSDPVSIKRGPAMKNSFGFGGGNGVLILGPTH
jgi:3-oxoacyl-[acyl-carrier-protein] synthase II